MNVISTSPDGKLRLRQIGKSKGTVELLVAGDRWVWCVYRNAIPIEKARDLFDSQSKFHGVSA